MRYAEENNWTVRCLLLSIVIQHHKPILFSAASKGNIAKALNQKTGCYSRICRIKSEVMSEEFWQGKPLQFCSEKTQVKIWNQKLLKWQTVGEGH